MCKIKVDRLYYNNTIVEVHINDIKKAITCHENLIIEYQGHEMELSWEILTSRFDCYKPPKWLKMWSFKFVPNYHLKEKI